MRQKKVWRYYCDHCKKAGCGKAALLKHEASCTLNPERICKVHKLQDFQPQRPMADLLAALSVDFKTLKEAADGCPACIFAALRQSTKDDAEWFLKHVGDGREEFNFKQEMNAVWAEFNEALNGGPY